MRVVLPWVAWIVLVPAIALAAPKKPKKPAKKPPATKPAEPPAEPPAPDPEPDTARDARAPAPSSGAGNPGAIGGGGAGGSGGAGAGGGGGDAARQEPPAEPEPPANEVDVDSLRQEYLSLRDELFKSRARANAVQSQLYSTRIQIKLTYTSGRYYTPVKSSIRLDGATVYENADGAIGGDDGVRFDGYVAPGRHLITFRVEAVGKDDDTFASVTETQVVVKAVTDKDLVVAAKARDGGDIAFEWKKKEKGSYGLALDVAVKAQARPAEAKGAATAKAGGQ